MAKANQEQLNAATERLSQLAAELAHSASCTLEEEAAIEMRAAAEELDGIRQQVAAVVVSDETWPS